MSFDATMNCYKCNHCGLPLPLRLPRPGEVASSWVCSQCRNHFHATLVDGFPPEILSNVRPCEDVNPRVTIAGKTLAAMYKREGRPGRVFEERHDDRVPSEIALVVSLENGQELHVNSIDLSANGMGFKSERPIEPGIVLTVQFESLPGQPLTLCIVRNCARIQDNEYRIGAAFKRPSVE